MPRFEERMRFSLTEIGAIHDMLHKLVHALAHQCQKLGARSKIGSRLTKCETDWLLMLM
jgi:hypothetical protein